MDIFSVLKNELGPFLKQNEPLALYTTYKIGGPARFFVQANDEETAVRAVRLARENNLPLFVLGRGSNILISDTGFDGLVLHPNWKKIEVNNESVKASAGVRLDELITEAQKNNLVGLECLAGIPGQVGGSIRGNAGTFGEQIGDFVIGVRVLAEDGQIKNYNQAECEFKYRSSIFKKNSDIILEAELKLAKGDAQASQALIEERLKQRWNSQPSEPSVGCIFKNIQFSECNSDDLKARGVDVEKFSQHKKIPAAYLIESLNLKGKTIGQIQVSEKHANFLINKGGGTAKDVCELIELIKKEIKEAYGLELNEEVQKVGFSGMP